MNHLQNLTNCLSQAEKKSHSLGINFNLPVFKKLNDDDELFIRLISQSVMNLPYIRSKPGRCALAHYLIYKTLQICKIHCELVIGKVLVNGKEVWPITQKGLKEMLQAGATDSPFAAHVWLLLPDHSFVDVTLCTDINRPPMIICSSEQKYNYSDLTVKYIPLLLGKEYIEKTNNLNQNELEEAALDILASIIETD